MSTKSVSFLLNHQRCSALAGVTVVAALATNQVVWSRRSVTGEPRAALCGMGVCFECRVTIDGVHHLRACQTLVREDMSVVIDDCN
ncbi:MAG TPA: (2Fe-2S)-binding protein [Burkholderiaceae bacterium]|jgi:D-hydroxyproline dehydrogenase subunit gamma|nr:(2Fe-2S)-binding protein [Burkholderiaceae bacterium]HPH12243.1 (2Fe-2S)-binding protein [Burkholderiaceae bacterium]